MYIAAAWPGASLSRTSLSLVRVATATLTWSLLYLPDVCAWPCLPLHLIAPSYGSFTSLYSSLSSHCTHGFHVGFPSHPISSSPCLAFTCAYFVLVPFLASALKLPGSSYFCHASSPSAPSLTFALSSQHPQGLTLRLNPSSACLHPSLLYILPEGGKD